MEEKIIHNYIKIPQLPDTWAREIYSRNSPMNLDIFEDDDLILSSDLDEIPNLEQNNIKNINNKLIK